MTPPDFELDLAVLLTDPYQEVPGKSIQNPMSLDGGKEAKEDTLENPEVRLIAAVLLRETSDQAVWPAIAACLLNADGGDITRRYRFDHRQGVTKEAGPDGILGTPDDLKWTQKWASESERALLTPQGRKALFVANIVYHMWRAGGQAPLFGGIRSGFEPRVQNMMVAKKAAQYTLNASQVHDRWVTTGGMEYVGRINEWFFYKKKGRAPNA